jgi:hypothetical protein
MLVMNEATRSAVAAALENLASQESWNPAVWQQCYNLVTANWHDERMEFVHHDLIHYDDVFRPRHILGFPVKSENVHRLDDYRQEFRAVAGALRANMSLMEARQQFGL